LAGDQIAHHVGVLIGLGASTTMGFFSSECVQGLVVAEDSNIFLIGRNLMKENGIESGKLYDFVVVGFIVSFFTLRMYGTFFLKPHLTADPLKPLFLNLSGIILFWISWLWMLRTANLATKHFSESFPDNQILKSFYGFLVKLRKPIPQAIFYTFVTWLTTRWFIKARFGVQWI